MLSNDEVAQFERDGFVFPVRALSFESAERARGTYEALEKEVSARDDLQSVFRHAPNLVVPMIDELSRSEMITGAVSSIIGEDLLLYSCGSFIKEPRTKSFISWHQDLHYWGLEDAVEVTAWVALSRSNPLTGCVKFLPGSQQSAVPHRETDIEGNMLSRGQEVSVDVDESASVDVVLTPGEMSLHHGLVFHASGANSSDERRIGLAFRYISTKTRQEGGVNTSATLVRGEDRYGNFHLLAPPSGLFDEADVDRAKSVIGQRNAFRMR